MISIIVAGALIIGDADFVATSSTGQTIMQGEFKSHNQIHTRRRTQYHLALSSKDIAKRRRVSKTAGQLLMYMVSPFSDAYFAPCRAKLRCRSL